MSTPPTPPGQPNRPDEVHDPTGMRALLSSLPDPGPMPPDLVHRITASIASEQAAREGERTVVPLARREHRWRRAALVAAAAAVVAIGVPALVTGSGPGDVAAFLSRDSGSPAAGEASEASDKADDSGGSAAQSQVPPTGSPSSSGPSGGHRVAAAKGPITIYATGTAYTMAALRTQLQAFVDHPGSPVAPLASESPALGPVATPAGLEPCLRDLGIAPESPVAADVATFDGAPAVVLVVSTDTGQTGYAVSRDCVSRQVPPLAGPLSLG